jgi:hypothetical protein
MMSEETEEVVEKTELELLREMRHAALELAQYTSYSEIVGGIHHNRPPIREWCDKVFEIGRELADMEPDLFGDNVDESNIEILTCDWKGVGEFVKELENELPKYGVYAYAVESGSDGFAVVLSGKQIRKDEAQDFYDEEYS